MFVANNIGIIADDLTGADDTALQFHNRGCNTQMILDLNANISNKDISQCWAVSTESRNIPSHEAMESVKKATEYFKNVLNVEYFYKKIDSTLRGNISKEVLTMLDTLNWDAAVILPAFPIEKRITVGGYHLLAGEPIERTEIARDPYSPVYESHIPTILKKQISEINDDIIGLIELNTVTQGAGPILFKLNELIAKGKKLIVTDAVSKVDIAQVVLAMGKSNYKILPCGSAAMAECLADVWLPEKKYQDIQSTIPVLPKLVISGSATKLTATQINELEKNKDFSNTHFIPLKIDDIMKDSIENITEEACKCLINGNIVVIHSSDISINERLIDYMLETEGITKERLFSMITDYLAQLTANIIKHTEVILITLGGETSYKCCHALNSQVLQIVDAVTPTMPLCMDYNAQWIVTKSGNLGNSQTLIEILKYFEERK